MNRRHFIKTAVAAASLSTITAPAEIVNGIIPVSMPESVKVDGDWFDIFTVDELQQYGIRSARYSANCIDRYGKFGHERGYFDLGLGHSEPFVRKTILLQCLPKIYSDDSSHIMTLIKNIRSGQEYSLTSIIEEIKKRMEYVCLVAYAKTPCLCGRKSCKSHFIPIVGGLSKYRYQLYLKQMNENYERTHNDNY